MNQPSNQKHHQSGFTLLELLIVIAIIAIMAGSVVLVLNPSEILKRSRDVQRMSDLATLKSAIGIYTTTVSPAELGGASDSPGCSGNIFYSSPIETVISGAQDGRTKQQVPADDLYNASSTANPGWLPINFGAISGGSPIASLPVDPTNAAVVDPVSDTLVYRYACDSTAGTYEIDTRLESDQYKEGGADDRAAKDGGNNPYLYEVGTDLTLLGAGSGF